MAEKKVLVEYTKKLQNAVNIALSSQNTGVMTKYNSRIVGRSSLDGENGGGSIAIGVLTSGPNNGYGPATWKAIVVNPDGTWTTTGQNIPVVVPAIK